MRQDAIAILVLAIFVVACDDKPAATTGPPFGLRPLSVRVDGPAQVTPPAEVQFTALQTWSDGSTRDVTASALWTSTNPSVLSVSAGFAKALAGGEIGLTAEVVPLTSQPKSVRVVPSMPEWDGTYTLTIAGGACNMALPLPPDLRQRVYTAVIRQNGLTLTGTTSKGVFGGQIFNPQVRFFFSGATTLARPVNRASVMEVLGFRRAAYFEPPPSLPEVLPDGNRLVITGEALTTMSPSGFAGTLNGALTLYDPRGTLLAVCSSPSHGFTLVRS